MDGKTVAENLLNREEAAAYVSAQAGRTWTVKALDAARSRKATSRRPAFPDPALGPPKARSPLWWRPDLDEWIPYAFPKPMPPGPATAPAEA